MSDDSASEGEQSSNETETKPGEELAEEKPVTWKDLVCRFDDVP